jgi:hypothetical protein
MQRWGAKAGLEPLYSIGSTAVFSKLNNTAKELKTLALARFSLILSMFL